MGGIILLFLILSFVIFDMAMRAKGPWCTDQNPVLFSFPEPFQSQALEDYQWFLNNGESVFIKSKEGFKLHAKLFKNPNAKRNVIMVHGYRGKPEYDFSLSHRWYYNQDSNILIIYQRGQNLSEGKYITMGAKERDDLHLWEEFLEGQNDLPIYLVGISMGATTVLSSFYRPYSSRVKGIVADCGYYSIYKQLTCYVGKFVSRPVAAFFLLFAGIWTRLFAKFSLWEIDTRKIVKNIDLPIVFAHGDSDKFVLPFNTEKNFKSYKGENKVLVVGHKAAHGYTFLTDENEYKQVVKEMMKKAE